jgi:FkbM family methyltransferase
MQTEGRAGRMDSGSARIVAHHVGARGYRVSLNVPEPFRSEVLHVLFDADREAVERMEKGSDAAHSEQLGERRLYPYCLGRARGPAKLHITANNYASSLLEPDPDFLSYYAQIGIGPAYYDVTYRDMLEVKRTVEVQVESLDGLLADGLIAADARPDFLSIDTQGYELEVLEGAREAITGVVGIVCEVEMQPMYRGQPLLGDVLVHMTKCGFVFAGYTSYYEASPYRAPIGMRGNVLPAFGDALFLRDPKALARSQLPAEQRYLMLMKLALVAVNFAQIEFALATLEQAKQIGAGLGAEVHARLRAARYIGFLDALQKAAEQHAREFLPVHAVPDESRDSDDGTTSWYDKHHAAAVKRIEAAGRKHALRESAIRFVFGSSLARAVRRLVPEPIERVVRAILLPQSVPPPRAKREAPKPAETAQAVEAPAAPPAPEAKPSALSGDYTPFEIVLHEGGFIEVMRLVRDRRLAARRYLDALSAEMRQDANSAHLPRG